jgi:ferredoxin
MAKHHFNNELKELLLTTMYKLVNIQFLLLSLIQSAETFSPVAWNGPFSNGAPLFSSSASDSNVDTGILSVSLEKPLGMILEEVTEGAANGVFVKELADSGSAYASEYKDKLVGLKLARVMEEDVTLLTFDNVMEKIINAPSPLTIDFEIKQDSTESIEPQYQVGTEVTIRVIQEGQEMDIQAKVGDNLRQTLLDNNVEVYRGLKKKLGNCGGAGQCTFCAVDFVESEGWEPRSEYEDNKIGKKGSNVRLSCLNNIQGPATIRMQ